MATARQLIERLRLEPHPEGGWFRETWRAPAPNDERSASTAIHFLLEAGQRSHWHRVDAAEIWLWHAGDPLELATAAADHDEPTTITLGGDVLAGEQVQHVVAPHFWQAARPLPGDAGYSLMSCVVAPGFDFAGFELAPPEWKPGP